MTRYLTTIACLFVLLSCNNSASTEKEAKEEPATPAQQWFATDTIIAWDCSADEKQRKRIFSIKDSVPFAQAFINGINKTYGEIKMNMDRISSDTLYVTFEKPEWLTDRAGNSGAEQYLSFATLNLLETKAVHYVTYVFPPGAHARPATWTIADFSDWKLDPSSVQ